MGQYLLFNGALNVVYLGLPAYIWVMLALFIVCVGSYAIWWFFFWMPLSAVQGHFKAHISKINSALTFDEHLNFVMRSEKKAKLIFQTTVKEAREIQKDWDVAPSGLIGRVLNDLIFDGGQWLKLDSPVRAEIERVAAVHNDANPDNPVMELGKFYKELVKGTFGACETIPRYYKVDWKRIDFAIPSDHIQPMWDGYLRQLARKLNTEDNADLTNYGYLILGISALICVGMLAIRYLK